MSSIIDLEKHVSRFLSRHLHESDPVLIGFSGGVDSSCLLNALRGEQRRLVAVHVDHAWREESSFEAAQIRERLASMGIECRVYRMPSAPKSGNLEDWSRQMRYTCFRQAAQETGIHTILLAHQADDQIETVIKRFLEGSSVVHLRGIRERDNRDGLCILRPMLEIFRGDLERYACAFGLQCLRDPSNEVCSFLRPRLRKETIPLLEQSFGKNIRTSIVRVAREMAELEGYLGHIEQSAFDRVVTSSFVYVERTVPVPRYAIRMMLRNSLKLLHGASLSRQQYDQIVEIFHGEHTRPVRFHTRSCSLTVQGGKLCLFRAPFFQVVPTTCDTRQGSIRAGLFDVSWHHTSFCDQPPICWRSIVEKGDSGTVYIPPGPFSIQSLTHRLIQTARQKLDSPALLRPYIPAVVQGFRLVGDLLSGYTISLREGDLCCAVEFRTCL